MQKIIKCGLSVVFSVSLLLAGLSIGNAATMQDVEKKLEPIYVKGKYDQLIKEAEKLLSTLKEDEKEAKLFCYIYIADAWGKKKNADKQMEALNAAIAGDPKAEQPYLLKVFMLARDGKVEDAKYICKQAEKEATVADSKAFKEKCNGIILKENAIGAKKLWSDFNENEVAAEDAYKGKRIAVIGTVSRIATSVMGYPEITFFVDGMGLQNVQCQFPKDERASIAKVKKGQKITVAGKCKGFTLGTSVIMDDCTVLK